jgi:hypothetical protein
MNKTDKNYKLYTLIALAGLSAGAATIASAQPAPQNATETRSSSVYVLGDYYNYKYKHDDYDTSLNMIGGTCGYVYAFQSGNKINAEVTYLTGSKDQTIYDGIDYADYSYDESEIRLDLLYTPSFFDYVSAGVEYVHMSDDSSKVEHNLSKHYVNKGTAGRPDPEWDGTYTDKATTYPSYGSSLNEFMAKFVVAPHNIYFMKGNNSSIYFKPRAEGACGFYSPDEGDGGCMYIGTAAVSFAYELYGSSIILDGGYSYVGYSAKGSSSETHFFGRVGYSYSW